MQNLDTVSQNTRPFNTYIIALRNSIKLDTDYSNLCPEKTGRKFAINLNCYSQVVHSWLYIVWLSWQHYVRPLCSGYDLHWPHLAHCKWLKKNKLEIKNLKMRYEITLQNTRVHNMEKNNLMDRLYTVNAFDRNHTGVHRNQLRNMWSSVNDKSVTLICCYSHQEGLFTATWICSA